MNIWCKVLLLVGMFTACFLHLVLALFGWWPSAIVFLVVARYLILFATGEPPWTAAGGDSPSSPAFKRPALQAA